MNMSGSSKNAIYEEAKSYVIESFKCMKDLFENTYGLDILRYSTSELSFDDFLRGIQKWTSDSIPVM